MIALRKWAIILAALGLGIYLVYDFAVLERTGPLQVNLPQGAGEFEMKLRLANLFYDSTERTTKASVQIEITAAQPGLEISSVALSVQKNPEALSVQSKPAESSPLSVQKKKLHETSNWTWIEGADLKQSFIGGPPPAPYFSYAKAKIDGFTLLTQTTRSEIWYPFDASRLQLAPRACVNMEAPCGPDVQVETVTLDRAGANFVFSGPKWSADGITCVIERHVFVRLMGAALIVSAVVFFAFLLWPPGGHSRSNVNDLLAKSLGFVGALWGIRALIVPSTVNIFPNLVDFVVLSLFTSIFVVILVRVNSLYRKEDVWEQEWD